MQKSATKTMVVICPQAQRDGLPNATAGQPLLSYEPEPYDLGSMFVPFRTASCNFIRRSSANETSPRSDR